MTSPPLIKDIFSLLLAPVGLLAGALNSHLELQRYKILFISGRSSSWLNRNITELDVRRAFTVFQLMTILEENQHSFLIVEHEPLLYEDAGEMVEYLAQALRQASREATVLLYAPTLDPYLQKLTKLAYRIFCIYEERSQSDRAQAGGCQHRSHGAGGGQRDLVLLHIMIVLKFLIEVCSIGIIYEKNPISLPNSVVQ